MPNQENYIYILLHIPKCAGTTLGYHIEKNFKPWETIHLSLDFCNSGDKSGKYNIIDFLTASDEEKERMYKFFRKERGKYFKSLKNREKDNIKVIHGHFAQYGIHEYFNKPYRYITFVRDPVERTISEYNYNLTLYYNGTIEEDRKEYITEKGRVMSLERFLEKRYDLGNPGTRQFSISMTRFLKEAGYLEGDFKNNPREASFRALRKFYFVGLTEKYNKDALFIYNKLGLKKFFPNKNVSKKFFTLEGNANIRQKILEKNKEDSELYQIALELNKTFKRQEKHFYNIVYKTRIRRALNALSQRPLQWIYNASAKLKKHSILYMKIIQTIKGINE